MKPSAYMVNDITIDLQKETKIYTTTTHGVVMEQVGAIQLKYNTQDIEQDGWGCGIIKKSRP